MLIARVISAFKYAKTISLAPVATKKRSNRMPRYFRRGYKKRAYRRKRAYMRNRGARSQALQLSRLSGKVARIQGQLNAGANRFFYYNDGKVSLPDPDTLSIATGYGYTIFRIHPHTTAWNPCLDQPSQAQLDSDKWTLHSTKSQMRFEIGSENSSPIEVSVFILQIRKQFRDVAYYNWGADLRTPGFLAPNIADTGDTNDTAFNPFNTFSTGQVFLNRKIFKVLRSRKFTIGEVGYGTSAPAVRNIGNTVKHMSYFHKYGGKRGIKLTRSNAPITTALAQNNKTVDRDAWTWCLVVTNNSALDAGSPLVRYTNVHKLTTDD